MSRGSFSSRQARSIGIHPNTQADGPASGRNSLRAPVVFVAVKALIVDDEEEYRAALLEILLEVGECDIAENGKEAVNAFHRAWSEGDPYDLVCLDIQMPVLGGFETLKILREMERAMNVTDSEQCRVFMVTSNTGFAGKDLARSLGCDAYFLKPLKRVLFLNRLQTFGLIT